MRSNLALVFNLVSLLLIFNGIFMLLCLLVSVAVGDGAWDDFAWSGGISVLVGALVWIPTQSSRKGELRKKDGYLVVALGWVFSSFLQSIAGFGTPIAIVAPLLVAFGVRPVQAVVIPLIAHLWAKFFGTLGVSWFATLQVVDLADPATTAFQSGLLLVIPCVLGGFTVVWIYGKWPAVRHAWPLVLIIAALQAGGQAVFTLVDPVLCTFVGAAAALVALYPLSRWRRYAEPADIPDRPAMREARQDDGDDRPAPMGFAMSFLPYVVLSIAALGITAEQLLAREDLATILTYHVVPSAVIAEEVIAAVENGGGEFVVQTVNGADISVTVVDGVVTLNGVASVITADLMAGNGVVHVIDAVLLPPTE